MRKVKFSTVERSCSLNKLLEEVQSDICDIFHTKIFSRLSCHKNSFPSTRWFLSTSPSRRWQCAGGSVICIDGDDDYSSSPAPRARSSPVTPLPPPSAEWSPVLVTGH